MAQKRKNVLFVDDDAGLLEVVLQVMGRYAGPSWQIFIASDVSQSLASLQQQRIDLLVIDVHMPVVDGLQFLNLLKRKYPNVMKVVLTGDSSEDLRATCLNNGAELFLRKPTSDEGWKEIYSTLDGLVKFQPEEGFRGVLRRVGLQDVLQMECLARNSAVLSVKAGELQGKVFVEAGDIIHAQCGDRTGETAFNEIMGLKGGEFELQSFSEPPGRTIEGKWEFLLMEAARKRDESSEAPGQSIPDRATLAIPPNIPDLFVPVRKIPGVPPTPSEVGQSLPQEIFSRGAPPVDASATVAEHQREESPPADSLRPCVEELLICSVQGDVLQAWQCANANGRVGFLEFLSRKARQLEQGLPLGEFDRLEINGAHERVIARIQPEWALFTRISRDPAPKTTAGGPVAA
jgi:CheY-like chemotaxis protein